MCLVLDILLFKQIDIVRALVNDLRLKIIRGNTLRN